MTSTPSTELIVAPRVNMNGSSIKDLKNQIHRAAMAITSSVAALSDMTPHGRDYQLSPNGAYNTARNQHINRLRALNQIEDELNTIYFALDAQER